MTTLLLLAHYDDEYCALPLLIEAHAKNEQLIFAYNAVPRSAPVRARRLRETERCLDHLKLTRRVILSGAERAFDGDLLHRLDHVFAELLRLIDGSLIDGIITPAWEGGHVDHDMCAVLGVAVAEHIERQSGATCPILQFSLYNGEGLIGPLFHGASPLAGNGPLLPIRQSPRSWLAFAGAVRFFPSQAGVWSTLWPAAFLNYLRHGFAVQRLSRARVQTRPHAGRLLYERRGYPSYETVAQKVSVFLGGYP